MTRPRIRAVIDDGPRRGETVVVDAESAQTPPHEILLPDGHLGMRPEGADTPHPTGAVSRYRLVDPGGGTEYHYKVVPHEP
jgi:hypothetical protein